MENIDRVNNYFCAMSQKDAKEASVGKWFAYRAWANTLDRQSDAFEVLDLPWGNNIKQDTSDFVAALREAGVSEIVVTDRSTSLMDGIHALVENGVEMVGTAIVERHSPFERCDKRLGLKFKVSGDNGCGQ